MATTSLAAQNKATLIYVGDPMCSWCYGFADEFDEAVEQLGDAIELEVVLGGLRPYNTQTMSELKDFLTEHWHEVHEVSHQPFRYAILDTDIRYDTEPACRAVMVAREMEPDSVLTYFHKVQTAFYAENKNPLLTDTYADIAESIGIDRTKFISKYESEEYKSLLKQDFLRATQLGVRSFPTVLLSIHGETKIIAAGYTKAQDLVDKVRLAINN